MILDGNLKCVTSGWLIGDSHEAVSSGIGEIINKLEGRVANTIALGIDAPRMPLEKPREHFWDGRKQRWRHRRKGEPGYGRHCEVVLKALGIGNPQWTRPIDECAEWMIRGFSIFDYARRVGLKAYEVFPTSSYLLLRERSTPEVTIDFSHFAPGPKDMLDACIAAATVHEFLRGRGSEVGGGDGLGTIILPRPLQGTTHPVFRWPD